MGRKIRIFCTPTFEKRFKKLPIFVKRSSAIREKVFRLNPFEAGLKTHKLVGKMGGYWSFSIDFHYRIVFRFVDKGGVLFVDVGTHAIYK